MKTVNIHEAKTRLSQFLKETESGETYIICRNGKPVAQLTQYKPPKRTDQDPVLSQIEIHYDPTEELAPDEWGEME
jgi:prevent-host-death family protein